MYGPTETTIWSTVSPIRGRRRAHHRSAARSPTPQVFVVDRNLLRNPIGVAGELLIGGAGVVRGYLDRPELTSRALRRDPAAPPRARVYRTGDLVRIRPDGEIEFVGRLDHQVKIRGYRIELGEIEAAIGRYPDTYETVVVARTDIPGDPRLIAYVVPRTSGAGSRTRSLGRGVERDLPPPTMATADPTFDIAGWNDSYTGQAIAGDEIREWIEETASRVRSLSPSRLLEIGCGTGLVLFRVAPGCERYVGIDVAQSALDNIEAVLQSKPMPQVQLLLGAAHEVTSLVDEKFDTIVINSVAQYFPDADYLVDVITQAMDLLEPGGSLFLGDLRSLGHLPMFAAALELARAPADMARRDLTARAQQRVAQEEELLVDPDLFPAVKAALRELEGISVLLKTGRHDNELTRFRYDVVLQRTGIHRATGGRGATAPPRRSSPSAPYAPPAGRRSGGGAGARHPQRPSRPRTAADAAAGRRRGWAGDGW